MGRFLLATVILAGAIGCGGGGNKGYQPEESGDSDLPPAREEDGTAPGPSAVDPYVVSNEQMAEIKGLLDRRRPAVSRCLAFAIDNQELPKTARGKISLQIVVARNGSTDSVKVIKTTIDSKSLHECVLTKVREIKFPEIPKEYETTYTYAFEAT